jgi:hypothetical protein
MEANPIEKRIEKLTFMIEKIVEFISIQKNIGIAKPLNRIFLFSSLSNLRLGYTDYESLLMGLKNTLKDVSIFLPAFSYNSRRNLPYRPAEIPSPQNGALSRVAFKENLHSSFRTNDEDFSYIVINSENLTQDQVRRSVTWKRQSFGLDSHHSELFCDDALIFCVGNGMKDGFAPALHGEALQNVPYRHFLEFPSQSSAGQMKRYFARNEANYRNFGKSNRERIINKFKEQEYTSLTEARPIENLHLISFTIHEYLLLLAKELAKDKCYFIK